MESAVGSEGVNVAEDQPKVLSECTVLPPSPEGLSVMAKNVMKANLFAKKRSVPPWESGDARSVDVADAASSHIRGVLRVVGVSEKEWGGSAFEEGLKRLRQA